MSHDNREYEVELVVTQRHLYTTFSRSPEEAEADAEVMFEDGDPGDIIETEIEVAEAFPIEDIAEAKDDLDDEEVEPDDSSD